MTNVVVLLKTNEGGAWILPQVAALRAAGATVTVVIPPGAGRLRRALDAAGVTVAESPFDFTFGPRVSTLRGLWRLRSLLRSLRPDAVLYHLYASALAVRLTAPRAVRKVHMVAGPLYLESPLIARVERVLRRLDTHVIAGSDYTRAKYLALGTPASEVTTIPYGVDPERFQPQPTSDRAGLGATADTFVAIMVAFVYAPKSAVFPGVGIKGHDVLLDAWRTFSAEVPDSLLLLVGGGFDGEGEAHRRRLLTEFQVADDPRIVWLDSVDDVRPYYAAADVSVSPSLSENHGAALEASAMGVPSIVSDAGGLPEAVTDATGWVVPRGDSAALLEALRAAAAERPGGSLARRGTAARARMIERFDASHSAQRVADLVLDRGRRG